VLVLIFGYLKTFLDIRKIALELKNFFLFLKRNKIINVPIIVSFLFLIVCSYSLISFLYKDKTYMGTKKRIELVEKIDGVLHTCGDKTAISISSVSIKEDEQNFRSGLFEQARACDYKNNKKNCIVNLIDFNDLYRKEQRIDLSTYNFLIDIGGNETPTYFNLRDSNNLQDLGSIAYYPVIYKLLTGTNWYREGVLNSLWVSSIINFNEKVIYVLTMVSAKPISENLCVNQSYALSDIKSYLISHDE
jgi:hypothetical protein